MVGVNAGVVKADGGCLDWAAIQLDCAEVEGDAGVGRRVLEGVEPSPVAGLVKHIVALHSSVQDQTRSAPVQHQMMWSRRSPCLRTDVPGTRHVAECGLLLEPLRQQRCCSKYAAVEAPQQ